MRKPRKVALMCLTCFLEFRSPMVGILRCPVCHSPHVSKLNNPKYPVTYINLKGILYP